MACARPSLKALYADGKRQKLFVGIFADLPCARKKVLPRPSADRQSLIFNPLCPEENPACNRAPPPMQANCKRRAESRATPVEKRRNRTEPARPFEHKKLYFMPLHKKFESFAEVGQLFVGTMQRVFLLQAEHIQNGAVKEIRKLYQISGAWQNCA